MKKEFDDILMEMTQFEKVAQKIVFCLVSKERYKEDLGQLAHIKVLNMTLLFAVQYEDDEEIERFIISNKAMEAWKISLNQLCDVALANTRRLHPLKVMPMKEMFFELAKQNMGESYDLNLLESFWAEEDDQGLYVITNKSGVYGASVMLYDDILKSCANIYKSDLVILPSSVHEILCCKYTEEQDVRSFSQMVYDINRQEVRECDRLADGVYIYHKDEDLLECVETGEKIKPCFESVKKLLESSDKVA